MVGSMIKYKELPQNDWGKLDHLIDSKFIPPMGKAVVAEDEGRIISYYFLSPRWHAEPIWVDPEYSGKVYIPKMLKLLLQGLEHTMDILCLTPKQSNVDEIMRNIGDKKGFQEMPYNVWLKRF
jgi:hypothetical protein